MSLISDKLEAVNFNFSRLGEDQMRIFKIYLSMKKFLRDDGNELTREVTDKLKDALKKDARESANLNLSPSLIIFF